MSVKSYKNTPTNIRTDFSQLVPFMWNLYLVISACNCISVTFYNLLSNHNGQHIIPPRCARPTEIFQVYNGGGKIYSFVKLCQIAAFFTSFFDGKTWFYNLLNAYKLLRTKQNTE